MAPRRPHSKSRKGCLGCKRRHNKCDEAHPRCASCKRLGVACIWPEVVVRNPSSSSTNRGSTSTEAVAQRRPEHRTTTTTTIPPSPVGSSLVNLNQRLAPPRLASPPGASGPPVFSVEDMQLLHQYTTATYATLDTSPAQYPIWQRSVIDVGFAHPFVLRGAMALAALHLATGGGDNSNSSRSSSSNRRWVAISSANLNVALHQFRQLLEAGVDDGNCVAVFAFSATIVVHALAAGQAQQGPVDPVADMMQCFHMVKGVMWAVLAKWPQLMASAVRPLLENGLQRGVSAGVDDVAALKGLVEEECCADAGERDVYGEVVDVLCQVACEARGCPPGCSVLGIVLSWPVMLPEAFLGFLAERRPVALVILLHYTALMDWSGDFWWLNGWHQRVKDFTEQFLPSSMRKWVPE